jgi:hypothetical protein
MANSFEHISIVAVKVLARLAARKAVEADLRAQGVRTTLVRPAELTVQANAYSTRSTQSAKLAQAFAR